MIGYLLCAGILATGGSWTSWRFWQAADPAFRGSWRGKVLPILFAVIGLTLLAFAFHVGTGIVGWTCLRRGPFDDFVRLCFWVSLIPTLAIVVGKGPLRLFPAIAAFGAWWLWLLVAAASFIM